MFRKWWSARSNPYRNNNRYNYHEQQSRDYHEISRAIDAFRKEYQSTQKNNAKDNSQNPVWTRRTTRWVAGYTIITAFIMGAAIVSALYARNAAETAQRTLEGVERPILLVSMPSDFAIPTSKKLDSHKTKYSIFVENVGKQVAKLIFASSSNYIIQEDSAPPPIEPIIWKDQNTACPIFFIGEIILKPNKGVGFWCQRLVELTPDEIVRLNNKLLLGFFRVAFVYADPIGTLRNSFYIFLLRPPVSQGVFVQTFSADTVFRKGTPEEQSEAERKFVGGNIEMQRGMDLIEATPSPP
jgi:hypothetical protein